MTKSYGEILRTQLGGVKYLPSGELNPNYNPKWGLAKGAVLSQARSYAKQRELFIPRSATENPIEYIATGILAGKSQYQFKEIENELKGVADARTRAVDISRLSTLINSTLNMDSIEYKHKLDGKEITETLYPPYYYAELYAQGQISRQEFFDYIEAWKSQSEPFQQNAYKNL